jgi:hypothetical protein
MKINLILKKIHIDNWFNDNKIDDYEVRILQANKQFEEKFNKRIYISNKNKKKKK